MTLRLGYACMNTRLPSAARTLRLANATPERLRELTAANLDALEAILCWNAENGIEVFRVTSNLIPFGSHPANALAWWDEFGERLAELGELIARSGGRVSTHPGQFTVLSSDRPEVVAAALAELEYHDRLLTALRLDGSHKVVLHVGSGAADPVAAARRFAAAFAGSPTAHDAGSCSRTTSAGRSARARPRVSARIPVVFDAFHHALAPSLDDLDVRDAVLAAGESWQPNDGRQEVHFSTQEPGKRPGAHAATIDLHAFARFLEAVGDLPLDCVLEVKDKEQSVLRARDLLPGYAMAIARQSPS